MSVGQKIMRAIGGGRMSDRCRQDPETKQLICETVRENKDGTKVTIASLSAQMDGQCSPVITDIYESEEGAFERLERKVSKRLIAKCKQKPEDY